MKLRSGIAFLSVGALLISFSDLAQTTAKADSSQTKADAPQSKGNQQAYGISAQTFTGTVVNVDGKSGRLTMKTSDNQEKQFRVDSMAALTLRSTDSKLSDLKPGDQIILTAEGNKVVSVSLSTSDLNGSSSGSPYRSQLGVTNSVADSLEAMTDSSPASATEKTEKVSGSVLSVDAPASLITLDTAEGSRIFIADPNTKYLFAGVAGTLANLKKGQPITIIVQGMEALSVDTNTAAE